jgi:hypothetical protein
MKGRAAALLQVLRSKLTIERCNDDVSVGEVERIGI